MDEWIKDLLTSSSFGSMLGIFVTAALTFFFTKMAEKSKQSTEISTLLLEKVFYPLYLKVHNKRADEIDVKILYTNLVNKKRRYYLYLPNDFIRIVDRIEKEIKNNLDSKKTINTCKIYTEYQYIRLRRELGYTSWFSINLKNKYGLYVFFKCFLCFGLAIVVAFFSVLALFGGEIYQFSDELFFDIMIIIFIVGFINICIIVGYMYYSIYWYFRFKLS